MPCVLMPWKDPALFALLRVFPDKNAQTGEKQNHEADSKYSGDNHIIEKHDGLLRSVCVSVEARLTRHAGAQLDRDQ